MKAIRIHEPGGPEVLRLEDFEKPEPGAGQILIQVEAAGVNYADTGVRKGMRFGPHGAEMPMTPGFEAAGTVVALGEGVEAPSEGTRVAAVLESGGYAEHAIADVGMVVEIPDGVDFHVASAALLVQGITAYGVLHDAARLQKGESVLVQAASGGVGSLAVQFARLAGAGMILGTAGSAEKRDLVSSLGASYTVDYRREDWTEQVLEATGGSGADVILESVGGEAGSRAFECLAPLGRLVMFGAASGRPMPSPDLMQLNVKGQTLSGFGGPWIRPGRAQAAQKEIFRYLRNGDLRVVGPSFPLAGAAEAHRAIERRATVGKVVLLT